VVRPRGADDVVDALREARARRLDAVPRGCGHSTFGQSLTDGICLDMRALAGIDVDATAGRAVAGAGATWREVLAATLPHGLTPPVLTDHLDVTVGGTVSAGGVGGASHTHGTQADNVLALDVVAGGRAVPCSPEVRPELFRAVLGGLGRHGVITGATLRLVPAPGRVLRCTVPCLDAADLLRVQREVAADDIAGRIKPAPDGWRYEVKATLFGDGPVPPGTTEAEELPFFAFADRMRPDVEELVTAGEWARPHPWAMVFLPGDRAAGVIEATLCDLAPRGLGLSGLVLVKPLRVADVPMLAAPPEPVLFSVLKTASPGCAAVPDMLAANRVLLDRTHAAGGVRYGVGSFPD
jgi:hypothetical protein